MTPLRTALIGCGVVGQIHAAALPSLPESTFVAVCDDNGDRAAAFASRYGAAPFTDLRTLFRDAKITQAGLIRGFALSGFRDNSYSLAQVRNVSNTNFLREEQARSLLHGDSENSLIVSIRPSTRGIWRATMVRNDPNFHAANSAPVPRIRSFPCYA